MNSNIHFIHLGDLINLNDLLKLKRLELDNTYDK